MWSWEAVRRADCDSARVGRGGAGVELGSVGVGLLVLGVEEEVVMREKRDWSSESWLLPPVALEGGGEVVL